MKDSVRAIGELNIVKYDQFGNTIQDIIVPNLVVATGLNLISAKLQSTSNTTQVGWMEIGTSTTAANSANTALISPLTNAVNTSSNGSGLSNIVVPSVTGIVVGQTVEGTGIAAGTLVGSSWDGSSTTIPITIPTTSGFSSGNTITFNKSRVALSVAGGILPNNSAQTTYTATFGAGIAFGAWTEAGLFTAASAGIMLSRTVFPVITKGPLDSITVTWTLTIS